MATNKNTLLMQLNMFKEHEKNQPNYYYCEWLERKYHPGTNDERRYTPGYHETKWTKTKRNKLTYKQAVRLKKFIDTFIRYTAKCKIRKSP